MNSVVGCRFKTRADMCALTKSKSFEKFRFKNLFLHSKSIHYAKLFHLLRHGN